MLSVTIQLNSLTWDGINTGNVYYAPLVCHPFPDDTTILLTAHASSLAMEAQLNLSWSIIGAISALGSLNSVIYTFSRGKKLR